MCKRHGVDMPDYPRILAGRIGDGIPAAMLQLDGATYLDERKKELDDFASAQLESIGRARGSAIVDTCQFLEADIVCDHTAEFTKTLGTAFAVLDVKPHW